MEEVGCVVAGGGEEGCGVAGGGGGGGGEAGVRAEGVGGWGFRPRGERRGVVLVGGVVVWVVGVGCWVSLLGVMGEEVAVGAVRVVGVG